MVNNFKLIYNKEDDKLILSKPHTRKATKIVEGKYGIELCYDIEGSAFALSIPEPDILFGISINELNNFIMDRLV